MLKVHETVGEQRVKFAGDISEVADDLQLLYKDTEKSRKQAKEQGLRYERQVTDADMSLEKVSWGKMRVFLQLVRCLTNVFNNVGKTKI